MKYFFRRIVLFTLFAVVSAYINHPYRLEHRLTLRNSRSPNLLRRELSTNHDSFEENLGPTKTPLHRAQSVAQFCFELGCTIQNYQSTIERLKRRKMELSNQMLIVEDQLGRMEPVQEQHFGIPGIPDLVIPGISDMVDINPIVSSWLASLPKSLHIDNGHVYKDDLPSDPQNNNVVILQERRKTFSDRALAIQNLLVTLEVTEYTGKTLSKDLAEQYRRIAEAERINIVATKKPELTHKSKLSHTARDASFPGWKYIEISRENPRPPFLPPTFMQFMVRSKQTSIGHFHTTKMTYKTFFLHLRFFHIQQNQCRGDHSNNYVDVDEEFAWEWFARKRVSAYPYSTSAAASKQIANKSGRARGGASNPFSRFTNSTSILRP